MSDTTIIKEDFKHSFSSVSKFRKTLVSGYVIML